MPYLIDGHNLIGVMPDVTLEDPDDEAMLIVRLRGYLARSGKKAVVYFDRRAPGAADPAPGAGLTVRFVSAPRTADDAIEAYLARLGRQAANWVVVSSDHRVAETAARAGARHLSSPAFYRQMTGFEAERGEDEKPEVPTSEAEIDRWRRLFEKR